LGRECEKGYREEMKGEGMQDEGEAVREEGAELVGGFKNGWCSKGVGWLSDLVELAERLFCTM
jgi:hypothetical protein